MFRRVRYRPVEDSVNTVASVCYYETEESAAWLAIPFSFSASDDAVSDEKIKAGFSGGNAGVTDWYVALVTLRDALSALRDLGRHESYGLWCEIDYTDLDAEASVADVPLAGVEINISWYADEADVEPWHTEAPERSVTTASVATILDKLDRRCQHVGQVYARGQSIANDLGVTLDAMTEL